MESADKSRAFCKGLDTIQRSSSMAATKATTKPSLPIVLQNIKIQNVELQNVENTKHRITKRRITKR
jgi:hypothetical protein